MLVPTPDGEYEIEYDELATLKHLGNEGCIEREKEFSNSRLADRLGVSSQTVSRRLRELEEAGLIDREIIADGQQISITTMGLRALKYEFDRYSQIFDKLRQVTFKGRVTDGLGEGKHFVSLGGYADQFREKLGYQPFPGTLNVELYEESVQRRTSLSAFDDSIQIEGWEAGDRNYGPATCYPATLRGNSEMYRSAHVIVPDRTHHDDSQLEVIAPGKLRMALGLEIGDEISVHVGGD